MELPFCQMLGEVSRYRFPRGSSVRFARMPKSTRKATLINNAHVHIVEQRIYGLFVRSANSTLDTAGDTTRIRLSGERELTWRATIARKNGAENRDS